MLFQYIYAYLAEKREKGADMAEFTPINTQEEFEAAVKDRLAREAKKYEGYTSPSDLEKIKEEHKSEVDKLNETMTAKLKEKDDVIAERDTKIKGYETSSAKMRIARETGLSYEAMDYIQGSDEEAMKKSAEALKALIGSKPAPPLGDPEPTPPSDPKKAAWANLSKSLTEE